MVVLASSGNNIKLHDLQPDLTFGISDSCIITQCCLCEPEWAKKKTRFYTDSINTYLLLPNRAEMSVSTSDSKIMRGFTWFIKPYSRRPTTVQNDSELSLKTTLFRKKPPETTEIHQTGHLSYTGSTGGRNKRLHNIVDYFMIKTNKADFAYLLIKQNILGRVSLLLSIFVFTTAGVLM